MTPCDPICHDGKQVGHFCWNAAHCVKSQGKRWYFEWHNYCGPLWLCADMESYRVKDPPQRVWTQLSRWRTRTEDGKNCTCDVCKGKV